MPFTWNPSTSAYSDAAGRAIPSADIRALVDSALDRAKADAQAITQEYIDGKISLDDWATQVKPLIKGAHSATALIASGGSANMDARQLGRLGARIRSQNEYFDAMVRAIEQGEQSLDGLINRVGLYFDSAISTYEGMRQAAAIDEGREALNVLGAANHCSECPAITDLGWIPASDMTPVGMRECGPRDKCSIEYR